MKPRPRLGEHPVAWLLAAALAAWAAVMLADGFRVLLLGDPFDLRRRWIDQQYFFHGQNPYDVLFHVRPVDPAIGAPDGGGYPPWSFTAGAVFVGLPWPAVRYAFAAYNLLSLGIVGAFGYRLGRSFGRAAGALLGAGAIAIASIGTTIAYGQYGLVVLALLLAAALLDQAEMAGFAGLVLGVSLLKPNLSLPFCACYLVRRRWKLLAAAAAYMAASIAAVWIVTRSSPWRMCRQMLQSGQAVAADMPGPLKAVIALRVPPAQAIPLVASVSAIALLAILWRFRDAPLLLLYSAAGVAARLWTYHRPYDDLIIMPLLIALGVDWLRLGGRLNLGMFLLVGLSLWLPLTFHVKWPIVLLQFTAWCAGLILLLIHARRARSG
jgi:Glycosyltransferase family 87